MQAEWLVFRLAEQAGFVEINLKALLRPRAEISMDCLFIAARLYVYLARAATSR